MGTTPLRTAEHRATLHPSTNASGAKPRLAHDAGSRFFVRTAPAHGRIQEEHMIHEIIPVGMLQCNCSIVGDEATGEAVVIDPGDDIERVQEVLARHKLKVRYIIATHAHIDHVGGLEKLKRATGAEVLMHEEDLPLYQNLAVQAAWLGVEPPSMVEVDQFLREGDALRWGSLALEVLHTPGHSPGSLSLHLPGDHRRIFSGDTLFQSSIGRTDLWGGSYREILRSIRSRLLPFPDETPVYPGHGPATTIGEEREHNPFLRGL
jgi:hydroxyacylglutathione hydrolase